MVDVSSPSGWTIPFKPQSKGYKDMQTLLRTHTRGKEVVAEGTSAKQTESSPATSIVVPPVLPERPLLPGWNFQFLARRTHLLP